MTSPYAYAHADENALRESAIERHQMVSGQRGMHAFICAVFWPFYLSVAAWEKKP